MDKILKIGCRTSSLVFIASVIIFNIFWIKDTRLPEMGFWVNDVNTIWLLNLPTLFNLIIKSLFIAVYFFIFIIFTLVTFKKTWKEWISEPYQKKYKKMHFSMMSSGLNAIAMLILYVFWFEKRDFITDTILISSFYGIFSLIFIFICRVEWFNFEEAALKNKKESCLENDFILHYIFYGYTFLCLFFPLIYALLNYDNFFYETFLGFTIVAPTMVAAGFIEYLILFYVLHIIITLIERITKKIRDQKETTPQKKSEEAPLLIVRFVKWLKGE